MEGGSGMEVRTVGRDSLFDWKVRQSLCVAS